MILLIDADEVAYIAALSGQKKWYVVKSGSEEIFRASRKFEAIANIGNHDWDIEEEIEDLGITKVYDKLRSTIADISSNISRQVGASTNKFFLSGDNNFRFNIATILPYKGNRVDIERPKYLTDVKEYIRSEYKAESVDHLEADDLLAINQTDKTVIVTQDKDLNMVPGLRYIKKTNKVVKLEDPYCIRFMYQQILTGDAVDNIPGLSYVGDKVAQKILGNKITEEELYQIVIKEYSERVVDGEHLVPKGKNKGSVLWKTNKTPEEIVWEIGNLLYMRRSLSEDAYWRPDDYKKELSC